MSDRDDRRLANLRRRVARARNFPHNTCSASRHLHLIADNLIRYGNDHIMSEEPKHAAESILAVLESLWKLRTREQKRDHAAKADAPDAG